MIDVGDDREKAKEVIERFFISKFESFENAIRRNEDHAAISITDDDVELQIEMRINKRELRVQEWNVPEDAREKYMKSLLAVETRVSISKFLVKAIYRDMVAVKRGDEQKHIDRYLKFASENFQTTELRYLKRLYNAMREDDAIRRALTPISANINVNLLLVDGVPIYQASAAVLSMFSLTLMFSQNIGGILAVDAIELHLTPTLQVLCAINLARWIKYLRIKTENAYENTTLILVTHSDLIVSGLKLSEKIVKNPIYSEFLIRDGAPITEKDVKAYLFCDGRMEEMSRPFTTPHYIDEISGELIRLELED